MDEYLSRNLTEFGFGFGAGSVVGFGQVMRGYKTQADMHRQMIGDVPGRAMAQIGVATTISFISDLLKVGAAQTGIGDEISLIEAAAGNVGNATGLVVGYNAGKALGNVVKYLYYRHSANSTNPSGT